MTREERIQELVEQLADEIARMDTVIYARKRNKVSVVGWIDLERLAEWVYARLG